MLIQITFSCKERDYIPHLKVVGEGGYLVWLFLQICLMSDLDDGRYILNSVSAFSRIQEDQFQTKRWFAEGGGSVTVLFFDSTPRPNQR